MSLFGTAGIRGPVGSTVTPELALQVGRAIGEPGRTVVVGRDGRRTGESLVAATVSGLLSAGATVERVGVVPTPALAHAARNSWGIMLTASHNPPTDNGIKLFEGGIEFDTEAERAVEASIADAESTADWEAWGAVQDRSVLPRYREAVCSYLESHFGHAPLEGLRIAVDCGAGTGGLATPHVLHSLGATVEALNATVDGHFPARESKPTEESLAVCRRFVASTACDLGLAHDGDADRLVVLNPDGSIRHEDTVLAAVATNYVNHATVDDPVVVTTPNASERIDEAVEGAGGRVERVRLGALHEGIARVDEGSVVFAAEPWKHIYPDFGGWIDGIVAAGVVACLVRAAGDLKTLCEPITERPYRKVSVSCPESAKDQVMESLRERLPSQYPDASTSDDHGIRLSFDGGDWVLVRPSGTEPYVRIYAESASVDELVGEVRETIASAVEETS